MNQKEEPVDSDQPEHKQLEGEYIKLALHHVRLRRAIVGDFKWIEDQMRMARESTHSNRIETINIVLSYLNRSIPELENALKHLEDQIDPVNIERLRKITFGETASGLPRMVQESDRFNYRLPQEDSRQKA